MHRANTMFWQYCARKYPRFFGPVRVLEVGSYDVNGSVRQFFPHPTEYVGVDWRPGPGVDHVSLAHHLKLNPGFDTVISASMLEHDPHWKLSLPRMVKHMAPDGIMLLSWGAALNPPHELHTATDGCFHSLPAKLVIDELERIGLYVHEFRYEYRLPFLDREAKRKLCRGCVALVAFMDEKYASGARVIDKLLAADRP
jgi:hypothetical protein